MRRTLQLDFNVEAIDPVVLEGPAALDDCDLMSPYVWMEPDGSYGIMVRVVPRTPGGSTGTIWYGKGSDGLSFRMTDAPVLAPGPGDDDIGGCEDPTVVKSEDGYVVYYTGVDPSQTHGEMLYATGPAPDRLTKQGVALPATESEGNMKEATVERTADGKWRLFYEFAANEASLIGLAVGEGVAGPWTEQPAPFAPRPDSWDNWHLSTGPILDDPETPVMFYNGATHDARWRIGWIAFDRDCMCVVDRCIQPLIVPPPPSVRTGVDIAFAASVTTAEGGVQLYYSLGDRALYRAQIRKS